MPNLFQRQGSFESVKEELTAGGIFPTAGSAMDYHGLALVCKNDTKYQVSVSPINKRGTYSRQESIFNSAVLYAMAMKA